MKEETARRITELSGVSGGLVVHHDCGDGRLLAALGHNGPWIVQGLSGDAEQVSECRRWLRSQELAGRITVRHWEEQFLPYADNLANLFVAENATAPPMAEVMRVLAPLGVACIKHRDGWRTTVKPWPDEIDQWTHWLHAADGNPVAQDRRVFIGGSPMPREEDPSPALALRSIRGEEGGVLLRLGLKDGSVSKLCDLPSPPVWDGIAINRQGLFVTLRDGKVMRFGLRDSRKAAPERETR